MFGDVEKAVWVSFVHHFQQQVSFLEGLFNYNPAVCKMLTLVSNLAVPTGLLQAQHAVFSLWHLDDPSLTKGGVPLGLLTGRSEALSPSWPTRRNLATDFLPSVVCMQHCVFSPLGPVSHRSPFPPLFPFSTLPRRSHQALETVRSRVLGRIDRPEQSAALDLQIPNRAAFTSYTQFLRLPLLNAVCTPLKN